jgi:hypothetical protein
MAGGSRTGFPVLFTTGHLHFHPPTVLRHLAALTFGASLMAGPIELPGMREDPGTLLLWDHLLTLKTGGGYKNNALLAAFTPQDTPLIVGGLEFFLTRIPVDGHAVTLFFSGDERRYAQPVHINDTQPDAEHEQTLLSQASYKYQGTTWVPGISLTHLHAEQVFDATELANAPGSVRAEGDALILHPSLRYKLPAVLFFEAGYPVNWQHFKSPVSSYTEFGPKLIAGLQYRAQSSIELSFQYTDRPFDSRRQTDALGQPLYDTLLTTYDTRYEIAWKHTWNAPHKFQTTLRGFHLQRVENGLGFSDYQRIGASVGARFELGNWAFRGQARWSTYTFALQIVSVFDPVPRTREDMDFDTRIEYRWTPRFRTYAEYVHEEQRSNVAADRYRSNTWQGGVELDF